MSSSHILVQSIHRVCPRQLPVFLVHVVGAGTRIVSNPDAEILHSRRSLLMDLSATSSAASFVNVFFIMSYHVECDDLSVRLLDLLQLHEEVPESRFGHNIVGSEDTHAVKFRRGIGLRWQVAANDLIFLEAPC